MTASELYKYAVRAYDGDEEARAEWIARVFPLAMAAAAPYNVRPELVLARAVMESGWGSDRYEEVMEARFGIWMACKAQYHNNFLGMVAYGGNDRYEQGIPVPRWNDYKTTFHDYAPHGDMSGQYIMRVEEFKGYRSVEDCFEDFCAVIRSQAARRGEPWPDDLREQLLSVGRGYTPEGAPAPEGSGFVYMWQCDTLKFIQKYGLSERGSESMNPAKMTTKNFEKHVVASYRYAHEHCSYGPTDRTPVPGSDGKMDCVGGVVYRVLYTMNRYSGAHNIDEVGTICEQAGMKKSTDPDDAWRRHGVVCMQDDHLRGTQHVSHVFYSYGGKSADCISKYDLGSDARIKAAQPFQGVPVNEWTGKRHFLCMYYIDDAPAYPAAVGYEDGELYAGRISAGVGMYEGPGTEYKKVRACKAGELVVYGLRVTNPKGKDWRHVCADGKWGWVYHSSVKRTGTGTSKKKRVRGDLEDGFAAVRVGAGGGFPEAFRLDAGSEVTVDGTAKDAGGGEWLHVYVPGAKGKRRGYIYAALVE